MRLRIWEKIAGAFRQRQRPGIGRAKTSLYGLMTCLLVHSALGADWNADFDEHTNCLVQELPQLQNGDYLQNQHYFIQAREKLLKNSDLCTRFKSAQEKDKFMVQIDQMDLLLKKRKKDRIKDLFTWEISYLLGSNAYFLPSFPMEIGGKKVIVQRLEAFEFGIPSEGSPIGKLPHKLIKKISLETYWKAHLQVYLLGMYDFTAQNIGVNSKGILRFFDNESCFHYSNAIEKFQGGLKIGYKCQSFDWPQFKKPLDKRTAQKVRNFMRSFTGFENKMEIYLSHRYPDFSKDFEMGELIQRLENLRNFQVEEGVSFRDFFASLYPQLSPGLEDLVQIVRGILGQKAGYGTTLWFMSRWIHTHPLSAQDKEALESWVGAYVD